MEIKIKHVLGFLSLCIILSSSTAHRPLCDIKKMFTNETWYAQTIYSVLHGDKRSLSCIAGCLLYTVDNTLGDLLKKVVGLPYTFFERCVKMGITKGDSCKIMECIVESVVNGLRLMESLGIHVPFKNVIERMTLFNQYNKYEVAHEPVQPKPEPPTTPAPAPQPVTTAVATSAPKSEQHSGSNPLVPIQPEPQPLCKIIDITRNVTAVVNIVGSAFFGDRKPLHCFFGCAIYSLDRSIGECTKKILGPAYQFFGRCIDAGIQSGNTCSITDCVMKFIVLGDHLARDFHLPVPLLSQLEKLPIFQDYQSHHEKPQPALPPPPPPTTPVTITTTLPPPKQSTGNSFIPSLTTIGISIFALLLSKCFLI